MIELVFHHETRVYFFLKRRKRSTECRDEYAWKEKSINTTVNILKTKSTLERVPLTFYDTHSTRLGPITCLSACYESYTMANGLHRTSHMIIVLHTKLPRLMAIETSIVIHGRKKDAHYVDEVIYTLQNMTKNWILRIGYFSRDFVKHLKQVRNSTTL